MPASAAPRLKISDNQRFLVHEDGSPFFYLGDTAWQLFHRLTREEADTYLQDRAAKGFTVIQAVVLAELDGLNTPNAYGHRSLVDNDPTQPGTEYFAHVDWIVDRAAELGLYIGMLPTWGDKWNIGQWGKGPEIFNPENARQYGEFLGRRYRDKPIIWILGGDRQVQTMAHVRIIRAMAEGLHAGDEGAHLRTFHPQGQQTSSQYFHCDEWLDFNMYQTGHTFDRDNWRSISEDYRKTPIKPCMDAEPGYEDHPAKFRPENGWLDDYESRKFAYWALFAGAHGHTYGCHDIWQFYQPDRTPITYARTPWYEAIHLPGAGQMQHAKNLLLSRPFLTRIPDQSLLASDPGTGTDHVQATRDAEGRYAFVYAASGQPFTVKMEKLAGTVRAAWYDPRTGTSETFGEYPGGEGAKEQEFTPPSSGKGNDWVLTLDAI
jgi:hypothetical protein